MAPSQPVIHVDDSDVVKAALFGKATFCMDRGYDDNKMFLKMDELKQDYVIRLKSNRKLLYHNKWTMATELRNRRKGKVKTNVFYKGKDHEAYLSHIKVQITASRKDIYLVLVYGITAHTMMLATNKEIKSKDDVIRVARTYFSRMLSYTKEGVRLWFRRGLLKCHFSQNCHSIPFKKLADWHFERLYPF